MRLQPLLLGGEERLLAAIRRLVQLRLQILEFLQTRTNAPDDAQALIRGAHLTRYGWEKNHSTLSAPSKLWGVAPPFAPRPGDDDDDDLPNGAAGPVGAPEGGVPSCRPASPALPASISQVKNTGATGERRR